MPHESAAAAFDPEEAAFSELRGLLLAQEQEEIRQLKLSLETARSAEQISKVLPQAVRLSALRDPKLRQEMAPVIEQSIRMSVRRDPTILSDALLPLIADLVKKTVARAMRQFGETLQSALEQSLTTRSFVWRMESMRSGRPFSEVVMFHSMLYRVEQVFLIHRDTGLLLAKCSADATASPDAGLVSSMLVAIQDFVRDSLGGESSMTLDAIEAGEYVIWIQQGPTAILAGIIRGMPPSALRNLFETTLEGISLEKAEALLRFKGEIGPFESCRTDLAKCLLGKASTQVKRMPVWPFAAAGICILVLVLAYAGWTYREVRRWRGLVAELQRTPGIVVVHAEHHNRGRSQIAGLRDPLAPDPKGAVTRAGLASSDVEFHWQPYRSEQPQFANVREYADLVHRVETQRIYFPFDNAQVPFEEMNGIEQMAEHVKTLLASAAKVSKQVRIDVVGHTDDAGTEQFNAELAAKRSHEILETLAGLGVPRAALMSSTALERRALFADNDRNRAFSRYVSLRVQDARQTTERMQGQ